MLMNGRGGHYARSIRKRGKSLLRTKRVWKGRPNLRFQAVKKTKRGTRKGGGRNKIVVLEEEDIGT